MPAIESRGLVTAPQAQNTHKALPPPAQLLKYFPTYEVLICTSCRHAIKPGGVIRHLKDIHHLSSEERRPYTLHTSSFKLKKPEEVADPSEQDFPMPYLPLEQGWKCQAPGCDYLCVSTKRMETHWPSKHGCKGDPSQNWSTAPLQTFFRGNMLRYFTSNRDKWPERSPQIPPKSSYIRNMQDKYGLDPIDSLALEHYFYSSWQTFSKDAQTEGIWIHVIADLAYHHRFLLHGILACTALHMAHIYPAQHQTYIVRAYAHQDSALPLFRSEIENPTTNNCDAIMAFGYLLVVFSFATELDNGQNSLLLVCDTDTGVQEKQLILPQWLHFIRCGCDMLSELWDRIENGPVGALSDAWETELDVGDSKLPYLDRFMSFVPQDGSWSEHIISVYRGGASALADAFAYMNRETTKVDVSTWNILGLWCVRLDDEFYDLIFERHPGTLILLAYYCVIMKRMETCWYFGGRPARLIAAISSVLDERWHPCLQEAADQVIGPEEDGS